jgi:Fe-Mn family superoxide dismutase
VRRKASARSIRNSDRQEFPMAFTLSPLPYEEDALEAVISARTISFHYHKHHKTYVDTLNKLVEGTRYAKMKLEEVVRATAGKDADAETKIFHNAGQVWNHDFYWRSLTPDKNAPDGALKDAIKRDFGGLDALTKKLVEAGKDDFGSGWAWLVSKGGKLSVEKTSNADTPMAKGINCLLAVDVWEHAYYLDYQNERPRYLEELAKILNWEFAAENLAQEAHPIRAAAE